MRALAAKAHTKPSTLVSRFFRLGLPSVRQYLGEMRLVYACAHMRDSTMSIAAVARRLNYSSPQSFGSHIHLRYRVAAGIFRRSYPFDRIVAAYIDDLVRPFLTTFVNFSPFGWHNYSSASR